MQSKLLEDFDDDECRWLQCKTDLQMQLVETMWWKKTDKVIVLNIAVKIC